MNELQKKLSTLNEEQVAQIYKNVFNTPEGKLVLQDLKNRGYYYIPLPLGQAGDRAEGIRMGVIHIETQINYEKEEKPDDLFRTIEGT